MGTYEGKTSEEWLEAAAACRQTDQLSASDPDAFLSRRDASLRAAFYRLNAELAKTDGKREFTALFDLDGNLVKDAQEVFTRFGWGWRIPDGEGVKWFNGSKARNGTVRLGNDMKKGYRVGLVRGDAVVSVSASGRPYAELKFGVVPEILDNGFDRTQYQDM